MVTLLLRNIFHGNINEEISFREIGVTLKVTSIHLMISLHLAFQVKFPEEEIMLNKAA